MPIEVVLFDADDTLWDFQLAARSVTRSMLARGAVAYPQIAGIDVEEVMAIRRDLGRRYNQDDVVGLRRETFRLALAGAGVVDPRLVEDLTDGFLNGLSRDMPLFPDTIPVLERLRHRFRMAMVSNGTKGPEAGGIAHFFETTVLGPTEGTSKPDPRLFHLVLERLGGVAADRALMVGDNEEYDIGGAAAAGIRSVLVDRRRTGSEQADAVIRELAELPAVIAGLEA